MAQGSPLLAATGNRHKLIELRAILQPHGIEVLGADDVGGIPAVEEDGKTFVANASKKAAVVAAATGRNVLADDSGLEVLALNGEPGVYSARYAGESSDDQANVAKLLDRLGDGTDRRARFVCVIAIASPAGVVGTAAGEVRGRILDAPRGAGGFGYDPVFVPDGFEQTFAELPAETKNRLSHRADALRTMLRMELLDRLDESTGVD